MIEEPYDKGLDVSIDSERMTWQSFMHHMRSNQDGLRNYANLIYAGLAKMPCTRRWQDEFMEALRPHVSRCLVCGQLVGQEPRACYVLTQHVQDQASKSLERHRDWGFYCMDYDQDRRGRTYDDQCESGRY